MLVGLFALVVAACRRLRHCRLLMVLVEEVPFEHCLSRWVFQMDLVFFNGLGVFPLLIVNVILVEIVVVMTWEERGVYSPFLQCYPVEFFEPRMCLDLRIAIESQSARCFPLKTFVYEVSGFDVPTFGYLILSDMRLLCKDGISDLFSTFSLVRSAAEHAFPGDNANGKVVSRDTMIVLAHDLGSHVARCARRLIRIVRIGHPFPRNSEVC